MKKPVRIILLDDADKSYKELNKEKKIQKRYNS